MRRYLQTIPCLAIALSFFAACGGGQRKQVLVAKSDPMIGPDGTEHFAVECIYKSINCLKEAGRICPSGYTVLERDGERLRTIETDTTAAAWSDGTFAMGRGQTTARERRDYRGSLVIKCKYAAPIAQPRSTANVVTRAPASELIDAGVVDYGPNPYVESGK